MSHSYYLELGHPATPPQPVDQQLRSIAESAGLIESVSAVGGVLTLHSGLTVSGTESYSGSDQFLQQFGIQRAAQAEFETRATPDMTPQTRDVLTLVLQLLTRIPDDAALHYEYHQLWLVRQAGQLWLTDRDDLWEPDLLAMVPPPYQRAALDLPRGTT